MLDQPRLVPPVAVSVAAIDTAPEAAAHRRYPVDRSGVAVAVEIARIQRLRRGTTMRALLEIRLPFGIVLTDVSLHVADDAVWALPAGYPLLDADRRQARDYKGRPQFRQLVSFVDRSAATAFNEAVVAAVRAIDPELLAAETA